MFFLYCNKNHPEKALRKRLRVSPARRRPNLSLYTCVCKETLKSKLTWTRSHSPPHCRDGCSFPCLSLFLVYRNHFNELNLSCKPRGSCAPFSRLRLQRYYKKPIPTKFFHNFFSRNYQLFSLKPDNHPLAPQKILCSTTHFSTPAKRKTDRIGKIDAAERAASGNQNRNNLTADEPCITFY